MDGCQIHVLTHGLHYASAVFEGERAYGGQIFKLREHTLRLLKSAQILGFTIPYSADEIDQACNALLKRQGFSDAYVRPIAWRGSEMMGISAQATRINLAIAIWQWPSYFKPEERLKGIRLDIAQYRRPDPMTAPCHAKAAGLYMICTLSKHAAEDKGYADAMMLDWRGQVAEATGANIFFVKDGKLHTADARLLPRRHHPPDRDRPGEAARHRGGRAGHHAGGNDRLLGVLPDRDGRGSHARFRNRALPVRTGRDQRDPDA